MQQSTACLHFRGVQRRCVWAVGRLGVAACLACVAAAVDRQARRSCIVLVWRCELTAGQVRSAPVVRPAVALRCPTHSDAERTCLAVGPTQFTPDTTKQFSLRRVWRAGVNSFCCYLA